MQELTTYIKKKYGISFNDEALLYEAFTHSSYANEHQHLELNDNERLEFLGDAVLEIAVSNFLFHKFKSYPEGLLTRLRSEIVREQSLYLFTKDCGFDNYIRLGKGEELNQGRQRPSLLADLFEAFLGSLYLDQGLDAVEDFLEQTVFPKIQQGEFSNGMDFKTSLQEFLQQEGEVEISYDIVDTSGPAHDRYFIAEVAVNQRIIGQGRGKSKKQAEQMAAKSGLQSLHAFNDR